MLSSLVPVETEDEIIAYLKAENDVHGLWLFQLIKVKSCDVEFTWNTGMLMHQIGVWAEEAETVEDFVTALKYYRHGNVLYRKCERYVDAIYTYFHENPRE